VVSSWKGGVWKTCLSASIAERLAFAGLDVLYLVTDDQLDARRRLGISEGDGAAFRPDVARVQRGAGSVTVVGLAGAHAVELLYRSGPSRFGRFDGIVVDTPPVTHRPGPRRAEPGTVGLDAGPARGDAGVPPWDDDA